MLVGVHLVLIEQRWYAGDGCVFLVQAGERRLASIELVGGWLAWHGTGSELDGELEARREVSHVGRAGEKLLRGLLAVPCL